MSLNHHGRRRRHLSRVAGVPGDNGRRHQRKTEETVVVPLLRGVVGAFVGLIFIVALLLMFGVEARGVLAHAVGKPTSSFTPVRLLAAAVLLGFGTGFVIRVPSATRQPPSLKADN